MSFLTPLYLLGLIGISLPIAFHFLRRTPSRKLPFSTLMFLKPSPPQTTRRSRLQHLPLLLLRALLLCLIAFAFARPFLRTDDETVISTKDRQQLAIVVDTSASMQREGLWQQAIIELEKVFRELEAQDQFAVWTFDRGLSQVLGFEECSSVGLATAKSLAKERLQALTPGWMESRLGTTLVTVADELDQQQTLGKRISTERKRVVVISDFQSGIDISPLQGYQWPKSVSLKLQTVEPASTTNASLSWLRTTEKTEDQELRIRVSNSPDSVHEQFQLHWMDSPSTAAGLTEVYVPPGQSKVVTLSRPTREAARLMLLGDDHAFDNELIVLQPTIQTYQIGFLGATESDVPDSDYYYLKRAFPESAYRNVKVLDGDETVKTIGADPGSLDLILVAGAIDAQTTKEQLAKHLESGGTQVWIASDSNQQAFRELAQMPEASFSGVDDHDYHMLGWIDFSHPFFAPFNDPQFSDFTKIHFWKRSQIELSSSDAKILARYEDGMPALVSLPFERGLIVLFGSGWSTKDSQLALSSKFVPLMHRILEQGKPAADAGLLVVGDDLTKAVEDPGDSARRLEISTPDQRSVSVKVDEGFVTLMPGIYRVKDGNSVTNVAVQLHPDESKTAPMDPKMLTDRGVLVEHPRAQMQDELSESDRRLLLATELESNQKLWQWLVAAALCLLACESWLAHRYSPNGSGDKTVSAGQGE